MSQETCAALLTLHILDSQPLTETLTVYLSQRTRTLNTSLAKGLHNHEPRTNGFLVNGSPSDSRENSRKDPDLPAKTPGLVVEDATRTTLETIARTLYTARELFGTSASARSLADSVLESIQSQPSLTLSSTLPPELLLNTEAVLNSLPSSTYVSLLPADIRSYRPFVDLTSASSSLPQAVLHDKLGSWFDQSIANLRDAFNKWLALLDLASAVWEIRSSLRKWVIHSGLLTPEKNMLTELLDELFHTRITDIWKAALIRSKQEFSQALGSLEFDNENGVAAIYSVWILVTHFT